MNILHIGSNSVHVSSYITALQRDGLNQFLVSEIRCNFENVREELNVSFKSSAPWQLIRSNRRLRNFIRALKPDILHIHQVNRLAYFAARQAKKMNIPVLTTAWGSDVLLMPQQNNLYRFLVKSVLKKSGFVTADSQEMIRAMEKLEAKGDQYVRLQYGITPVEPGKKENIVYSNRLLKPFYRVDQIIRYFAEFREKHSNWKLIVGGSGTEEQTLRDLCKELGISAYVEFIGFVDATANRSVYEKASIFISIPESDGTSVSLLEAMSAGCIPVVSDLEVSKEWIKNGENGIIENSKENPLEAALRLNPEEVADQNARIIEKEATREASLKVFNRLYETLTNE